MTKPRQPAEPGTFKNGTPFVEPHVYAEGDRDGLTKAEYVEARKLSPLSRPARRCQVCNHPEKSRVESLSLSGASLDALAEQFNLHRDSIWRHMKSHVTEATKASLLLGPAAIADLSAQAAKEGRSIIDYLGIVRSVLTTQLVRECELNRSYAVERVSGRLLDCLAAIGQQTGEVQKLAGTVFNITNNTQILNSPPFVELQSGLLQVCAAHPEARADIVALFRDLDAKHATAPAAKQIEHQTMQAAE